MQNGSPKGQILVVEDENIVALDIRQSLNRLGYEVPAVAVTGEEAIAAARKYRPDLILMDIRLRGRMDGIEAATHIRRDCRLPIIYLTAFADTKTLDRAKMTEPFGYILKPFEDRELNSTIEMALYRHQMDRRLQENERWLDTILHSIGDAVIATDAFGRISFMNPVAEALTDSQSERVRGQFFDHVMQIYAKSAGKIQPVHVVQPQTDIKSVRTCEDGSLLLNNGTTIPIDCTIAPLLEEERLVGSVVVLRDISRRKTAENALRTSEQRYRALFEQAQTALLTSELHNQINRSLMSAVNTGEVMQAIVEGVAQVISASHVFLHIFDPKDGNLRPAVRNHVRDERAGSEFDPDVHWPKLVQMVVQERRPIYLRRTDPQTDVVLRNLGSEAAPSNPGWNPFLQHPAGEKMNAVASVPLVYRGKFLGCLTAINLLTNSPMTERDVELMLVIANQATVAIENARLFEEAEQRAAALSRSNAELEQFAYVASHDMQEPLRMIRGYSNLLKNRYGGQDEDTDDFLSYILASVDQMDALIRDLLIYSRVGFRTDAQSVVQTHQIVDRVTANLLPAILESQAEITTDPLPNLAVDPTQFSQLLQNLLSNALKFRSADPPRIHIAVTREDGCYHFSVADNGIGIDEEDREHIFAPFRRLHTREEYPGTGIGLAICKRIVEAHRGRIWYESNGGKGTTFHFTICGGIKAVR